MPTPTLTDPDPVPGDFSTDREADRRTVVAFTHTSLNVGALPAVWVRIASQVFMVYDGTGFEPLFSGESEIEESTRPFLDIDDFTTHLDTIIESKVDGGALVSIQLANDGSGAGTLNESAYPAIVFHFQTGVTTVTNFETAIAASTHLAVKTAGTGAAVLTTGGDVLAATLLRGGAYDFSVIPSGGWWGEAEFFSADVYLSEVA